ncbi:MAG: aromatic ring-hydroxylating dioxygenase subunit alpha [Alphaproteobacteria bacterium]|nr:aromatic ring-hydroxylating dioxygenase subunit alpha [Alphaproteobacteria bacterium]
MTALDEITTALAQAAAGGDRWTMPPAFYTSPDVLGLEMERIFRAEWVSLGRLDEIPRAGDYFTTDLAGEELVAIRGEDGRVRVLSNVCRHRGTVILEGRGRANRLVCPYHAWTYGSDGRLQRAPHMEKVAGFEQDSIKLPEFAMEDWRGFIYVNLDGRAKPLAPRLAELEALVANYHMEDMTFAHGEDEVWATNWKVLAENFMEGYHLAHTHPRTLNPITPTALCEKFAGGKGFTGYVSWYDPAYPARGPWHTDLTEPETRRTMMVWVYPCHVVALAPNMVTYMCLRPKAAGEVAIRWGIATLDPNTPHERLESSIALARAYNGEDKVRLERLQRGLGSRFMARSRLGPPDLEGTVSDFFTYIAGLLPSAHPTRTRKPRTTAAATRGSTSTDRSRSVGLNPK